MIGYDCDGTLWGPYKGNGPIQPKEPYVVVTGNSNTVTGWGQTVQAIGTKYPIYCSPYTDGSVLSAARWKSYMIKKLSLTEFYDDIPEVCAYLKRHNPLVRVFCVHGTRFQELQ